MLLNLFAAPGFSFSDPGEAIKILPESTDFVIRFSSATELYDYFSVTEESFWGEQIENLNEIKENFGFNPFDLKEWKSNGFDMTKPFGVALSDFKIVDKSDNPHMNIIIYLPVKDAQKAVAKIKELVEDNDPDAKFTKSGDIWSWNIEIDSSEPEDLESDSADEEGQPEADQTQAESEKAQPEDDSGQPENPEVQPAESHPMAFYMVSKSGYLFIGTNPVVDARPFFETIGKSGKKLTDTSVFTDVTDKMNLSREVFLYGNLGRVFNNNPQAMRYLTPLISQMAENSNANSSDYPGMNYLKDYQGVGMCADLKSPDLKAGFVLNILEKSELFNLFKEVTPKRDLILGLRDRPLLLMGVVENLQIYWKMIQETFDKETLNTMEKEFSRVKTDYSIDLEKDLIQNLGGNLSGGIYDAMSINMANVNTLIAVEFKDTEKVKKAIEKVIVKLPPEQQSMVNRVQLNGSEVYMVPAGPMQIYAGFIGKDLVVTLGKPMFEKAMAADPESSFMDQFKDKSLKSSLQKDISIFFFDVGESLHAVKNFAPMLAYANPDSQIMMAPEFKNIMAPFDYISAVSRIDGNAMVGEFLFKSNFNKPFFQGVKDVTAQIAALKKSMNLNQEPVVLPSASAEDQSGEEMEEPEDGTKE